MKQYNLCQEDSNKAITKVLLSSFEENQFWREKYLRACINNLAPLKTYYCLPQRQFREADSNFSPYWYSFTNS